MDVIACLVTGRNRAAIATIELRGNDAASIIAKNFLAVSRRSISGGEVRYGDWRPNGEVSSNDEPAESVVVACADTDHWEIHCHGGEIAANRILDDLTACGVTPVDQALWLRRTGVDQLRQEALQALAQTVTERTAAIAMDQFRGAMNDFVARSMQSLQVGALDAVSSIRCQTLEILQFADIGLHLTKPWRVVLAGSPNVGKSSLINALVGYERSITLDQPGTTRDILHADAVIDGWPIRLTDTAGIRDASRDEIERQGIERAESIIHDADLVLWVRDHTSVDPAELMFKHVDQRRLVCVINKIDLREFVVVQPTSSERVQTSATLGTGIQDLRHAIISHLVPHLPPPGSPVPVCDRQVQCLKKIAEVTDPNLVAFFLDQMF